MREALDLHAACDVHRPRAADAGEVVSSQVDEHHVLRAVLLGGEEPLDVALGRVGRAGYRAEARAAVLARDETLGREADERDAVELEEEEVRRRVDPAKRPVDVERRCRRGPFGALRRHALEHVAGDDVLLHEADHLLVARPVGAAADGARRAPVPPGATECLPRACPRSPPRRPRAPRPSPRRGRSGRACRRRRGGCRGSRARPTGAAPSARAARRGRTRRSRRRAIRAPRPPRMPRSASRRPSTRPPRACRARPTPG